jgi:hypothetical protein
VHRREDETGWREKARTSTRTAGRLAGPRHACVGGTSCCLTSVRRRWRPEAAVLAAPAGRKGDVRVLGAGESGPAGPWRLGRIRPSLRRRGRGCSRRPPHSSMIQPGPWPKAHKADSQKQNKKNKRPTRPIQIYVTRLNKMRHLIYW